MVPTVTVRKQYACNNSVVDFVFDIVFFEKTDLIVEHLSAAGVKTTLVDPDDYSVSGNEVSGRYPDGGTVTTVATYPTGDTITIIREIPLTQLVDYSIHRSLPQEIQETVVDQLTCMIQQFQDYLDRSLYFPTIDPTTISGELPKKADRLNMYLRFHQTTGEPEAVAIATDLVGITAYMLTLVDDVNATEALTTLGIEFIETTTAFIKTLLDDADALTARTTLGLDRPTSIKVVADADYTVLDDDGYTDFLYDLVATDRAHNLPTAADNVGREMFVKIRSNTSAKLTITGEGAEKVNQTVTWELRGEDDWIHLKCDGTGWYIKGHYETELIYQHAADWSQAAAVQNTWYKVDNFELALPTGGVWDIEYCCHGGATAVSLEYTCADATEEEDDDLYTMRLIALDGEAALTKGFRRTFAANVTLHINARHITAGTPTIYVKDADADGYLRAKRIA